MLSILQACSLVMVFDVFYVDSQLNCVTVTTHTSLKSSLVILTRLDVQAGVRVWQESFVKIDHEIFSTVNHFLLLIQEGQFQVLVNRFED